MSDTRLVQLPVSAAKNIASCLKREARRLTHRNDPSQRDIRHAGRLEVYADLIDPPQGDDHGAK
jgi:hypothetical protein